MGLKDELRARKEILQAARDEVSVQQQKLDNLIAQLGTMDKMDPKFQAMQNKATAMSNAIADATRNANELASEVGKTEDSISKAEDRLQSFSDKVQGIVSKVPIIGESFANGIQTATDKAKIMMDRWLKETDGSWRRTFKIMGAVTAGLLLGGLFAAWKLFQSLLSTSNETMMEFSTAMTDTARTLQMSKKDVRDIGAGVGDWVRYGSGWASAVAQIRDDMGFIPKLTEKENNLVAKLATNAGLGADQIANMYRQSQNLGMELDVYVKNQQKKILQLNQENGTFFTQAEIIKEIAGASDETLAMFGKQNQELEKQVLIGKKIGLNLNQQASIAKSLLDIESSIEAEMEARVLTGKEINFDKARELALNGDISGASEEIMGQLGGIDEFNKMNIVQKEAIAKAAGLEVGQLQKSLEMQAGLADQANVGGAAGAGGAGVAGAASNADLAAADEARRRKWGGVLMPIAKALRSLRIAIEDKLYTWLTGPDGSAFITGVANSIGEVANWIATGTAPSWFTKFETDYIQPIKTKLEEWTAWIAENPLTSIGIALGGTVGITQLGEYLGILSDKDRDGTSKSRALWVRQTDGVFGDILGSLGGRKGGLGRFGRAFKKGGFKGLGKSLFRASGLKGITKSLKGGIKSLSGLATKLGGFLKKSFAKKKPKVKAKKGGLFSRIGGAIKKGVSKAVKTVKKGASAVKKGASKGIQFVKKTGSKIISAVNPIPKLKKGLTSKAGAFVKKAAKGVGKIGGKVVKGGLVGALFNAAALASILSSDMPAMDKAKEVVRTGAGILGGALGSIAGSIIPVVGTLGGGILGGLVGDLIGSTPAIQNALAPPLAGLFKGEEVEDFILSDRGLIKFRKDDLVIGGTRLNEGLGTGDNKALDRLVELMEKLIKVTIQDRVMSVDGKELATALAETENYRGVA